MPCDAKRLILVASYQPASLQGYAQLQPVQDRAAGNCLGHRADLEPLYALQSFRKTHLDSQSQSPSASPWWENRVHYQSYVHYFGRIWSKKLPWLSTANWVGPERAVSHLWMSHIWVLKTSFPELKRHNDLHSTRIFESSSADWSFIQKSKKGGWICPQGKWRVAFLPCFLHLLYPFIWTRSIMTTMMMIMSLPITMAMSTVRSWGLEGRLLIYDASPSHRQTLTPTSRSWTSITPLFKACNLLQLLGRLHKTFLDLLQINQTAKHTHNVESIRLVQRTHFRPKIHWSSVHSQMYWFYKALNCE